jgi:hypothetical protein
MAILKNVFLKVRLRLLEEQIDQEFDRELSLKIDRLHNTLEEISSNPKFENGSLAGVIKAISKKATAAALHWFQPEAILRAALWTTKKRLNGSGKY